MKTTTISLADAPSRDNATGFTSVSQAYLLTLAEFRTQLNTFINSVNALPQKQPCRLATTQDIGNLEGRETIDGYQTQAGDRILVKNQSDADENGIWIAADRGESWTRATDFDISAEMPGAIVSVLYGTQNGGKVYVMTNIKSTDNISTRDKIWKELINYSAL